MGQQGLEEFALAGLGDGLGEPEHLGVVDIAAAPGELLDAADLEALAGLDDLHEPRSLQERVEGAGVEPGGTARQDLHAQLALAEVLAVDVGDVVLAEGWSALAMPTTVLS